MRPALARLAAENATANGLANRVRVVAASTASSAAEALAAQGLAQESFDHLPRQSAVSRPGRRYARADALKAASHAMPPDALEEWARFMARMVTPGGRATLIHKADALPRILEAYDTAFRRPHAFYPIYPRAGDAAIRVIVSGIKGSQAQLTLKTGLVLHGEGHGFTAEAMHILRNGAALAI